MKTFFCLFIGIFAFSTSYVSALPLSDSRISVASQNKLHSIEALGIVPVGTVVAWPKNTAMGLLNAWVPCDGQPVPAKFPELASLMTIVPNLNGRGNGQANGKGFFLRGNTSAGEARSDSIRKQTHIQPDHVHKITLKVKDPTISGEASGQTYYEATSAWTTSPNVITNPTPHMMDYLNEREDWLASWPVASFIAGGYEMKNPGIVHSKPAGGSIGRFYYDTSASIDFKTNIVTLDTLTDSTLSVRAFDMKTDGGELITSSTSGLVNTDVVGAINPGGDDDSYYTGEDETRPIYSDVIYMIKAKP